MGKKTARGRGHQGGRKPPKGARRFKGGRVAPRAEQLHFPDDVQAVVCELLCDLRLPTTQQFALDICENVVAETDLRVVPNRATCFLDDFNTWLRDGQDLDPDITGLPISDDADLDTCWHALQRIYLGFKDIEKEAGHRQCGIFAV